MYQLARCHALEDDYLCLKVETTVTNLYNTRKVLLYWLMLRYYFYALSVQDYTCQNITLNIPVSFSWSSNNKYTKIITDPSWYSMTNNLDSVQAKVYI
jgi:hypothetical protein